MFLDGDNDAEIAEVELNVVNNVFELATENLLKLVSATTAAEFCCSFIIEVFKI